MDFVLVLAKVEPKVGCQDSIIEVANDLIYECAKLAKQYSAGADSTKIGVIYTKAKYLRKPPKAALGYVTYKNEKEILID